MWIFVLIAIGVLLLMIVIHELGHYVAGKAMGFEVTEFSVGFGPKLLQRTLKNGEKFTLRLLPLGGYCAFFEEKESPNKKSFSQHAPYKRIIVLLAGAGFNLVSAVVLCIVLIVSTGYSLPVVYDLTINMETGQPYATQLRQGDIVRSVEGRELGLMNTWQDAMGRLPQGEIDIALVVLREGEQVDVVVRRQIITSINSNGERVTGMGIGFLPGNYNVSMNLGEAVLYSVPMTIRMGGMIIGGLWNMISGQVPLQDMTGPVSTVVAIADFTQSNAQILLFLLPLIAVNLAVFNLIPFPALDGGRIVFVVIEWIRGKPLRAELESWIHLIGMALLFGLVIMLELARAMLL